MNNPKDSFSKFIYLSFAFHGVILAFLTVKILFFPSQDLEYKQSVRVDVVALPEKQMETPKVTTPQQPKIKQPKKEKKKKTPPQKVAPKKKTKPKAKKISLNKKKVKDEQDSAIARLKALQKLKKKQEETPTQEDFKGNAISKGNALTGLEKLHHDSYLDSLDGHIRNHWNLPEWLADGNLSARVLLLINKNGGIKGKSFIAKSGNDLFDEHVFTTIDKASPLPPPPANLVDFYATKGVEIRFPE